MLAFGPYTHTIYLKKGTSMRRIIRASILYIIIFSITITSCSLNPPETDQIPGGEDVGNIPSQPGTADTLKGTWTCITDRTKTLTFQDEIFFRTSDGTTAYVDMERGAWLMGNGYYQGEFGKDEFNCIWLEDLGYYHKDGTAIIEDGSASIIGGKWELEDDEYYMIDPHGSIYYYHGTNDAAGVGTWSLGSDVLTLKSLEGEIMNYPIRKDFGKTIVGDCVISSTTDNYPSSRGSLESYAGSYGHPGFYWTVNLDEYGLIQIGDRYGIVVPYGSYISVLLVDDVLNSSSFKYSRLLELDPGLKPTGSTTISQTFAGKWKSASEEWRIDAGSSYAEQGEQSYLLRQDGDRLFAYNTQSLEMDYVLRLTNGQLYSVRVFPSHSPFNPEKELEPPMGTGMTHEGDWDSGIDPGVDEDVSFAGTWVSTEILRDYVFNEDGSCLYPDGKEQGEGTWSIDGDGQVRVLDGNGLLHSIGSYYTNEECMRFNFASGTLTSFEFTRSDLPSGPDETLVGSWYSSSGRLHAFRPDGSYFGYGMAQGNSFWKCMDGYALIYDDEGKKHSQMPYSISDDGFSLTIDNESTSRYIYPAQYIGHEYVDAFAPDKNYFRISADNVATIRMNGWPEFQLMAYPVYIESNDRLSINLYTMDGSRAGIIHTSVSGSPVDPPYVIACSNMPYSPSSYSTEPVVLLEASKAGYIKTVEQIYTNKLTGDTVCLTADGKISIPYSGEKDYFIIEDKIYCKAPSASRCEVFSYNEERLIVNGQEYLAGETSSLEPDYHRDPALLGTWHNEDVSVHYHFEDVGYGILYKGSASILGSTPYRFSPVSDKLYIWKDGNFAKTYEVYNLHISGNTMTLNGETFTRCTCDGLAYRIEPKSLAEMAGTYVAVIGENLYEIPMIEIAPDGSSKLLYDSGYEFEFRIENGKLRTYLIKGQYIEDASSFSYMTNRGLYYGGLILERK